MALAFLLALLVRVLSVSVTFDVVTPEDVQRHEVDLEEQMIHLRHEAEQRNVEQSWVDMPALLLTLLDYWKIWFCMGLLLLLVWKMAQSLKTNCHNDSSREEEAAGAEQEEEEKVEQDEQVGQEEHQEEQVEQQEEQVEQQEQEEQAEHQEQVEQAEQQEQVEQVEQQEQVEQVEHQEEQMEHQEEQVEQQEEQVEQQEQVEQVEQQEQVEQVEQQEQVEQVERQEQEEEEDEEDEDEEDFYDSALTRYILQRALEKVQGKTTRCQVVEELMSDLLQTFQFVWSNSFFPVLLPAIGVGSAFEGWSPREEDTVYRLLVPMAAPHGHSFLLELGEEGDVLAWNSRIRVELQCMCPREQQLGDVLCFLHHQEDELSQNQDPSLLQTLCTGPYLDVQRTVTWFTVQVAAVWRATRHAHAYNLKVLPSSRSCKLQLTDTSSGEKVLVELLFGVQRGNSDVFLSSQNAEAGFTPSTTWPQSCAVAEKKLLQHLARKAGQNSSHLSCLTFLAHILVGMGFSTYVVKTLVFHVLAIVPLKSWRRRNLLCLLENLLRYLRYCLQEKSLCHFLLGNNMLPGEVVLPQAFPSASPLNLFQHLEQDPDAHCQALRDFRELKDRLLRLLLFGH